MSDTKNFISDEAYKEAKGKMPIACTDALILRKNSSLLFAVRKIEPMKGMPCIIGGRAAKGLPMDVAVEAKVLDETGLIANVVGLVGIYRYVHKAGEDRDDIAFTYVVKETGGELKTSFQHSKFVEINDYGTAFNGLHPRFRQLIVDSGLFEQNKRIAAGLLRTDELMSPEQIAKRDRVFYATNRSAPLIFNDNVSSL